jgi:hypothetical protein
VALSDLSVQDSRGLSDVGSRDMTSPGPVELSNGEF